MTTDTTTVLVDDRWVTIRPIRSTDSAMEAGFVRNLSAATKHYRFFCALKELSPADLSRFCNVDGPHTMAFVATVRDEDREVEIGVGRYAPGSKPDVREMAVTIADEWQHTGIAKLLMDRPAHFREAVRHSAVVRSRARGQSGHAQFCQRCRYGRRAGSERREPGHLFPGALTPCTLAPIRGHGAHVPTPTPSFPTGGRLGPRSRTPRPCGSRAR